MIKICQASSAHQLVAVRDLMRAFSCWHYERHGAYRDLIDQYFNTETFEAELSRLPGEFSPPSGSLLVAAIDDCFVGCVALRCIGEGVCEMKRLFVLPDHHGQGVGIALTRAVISEAKRIGYYVMRLDTGPDSIEAQAIYRKIGFKEIDSYYCLDDRMKDWLKFMELSL